MRVTDTFAKAFYVQDFGRIEPNFYAPKSFFTSSAGMAAVQFRLTNTDMGQVAATTGEMDFDGTGGLWKWRSALNDDGSIKMQLDANGLRVATVASSLASTGGLSLRLGVFGAGVSNATDAFVGVQNTGGPSGTLAGDLLLIPRSSTGVANGIYLMTGQGTPVARMAVKTDGKVGIGTAAPAYLLDVNGGINAVGGYTVNGVAAPFVPVGGIVAWAKAIVGAMTTPPAGFVECNGGTATMVYNGSSSTINVPDLNGSLTPFQKRFLRGATSYATTGGGSDTHTHPLSSTSQSTSIANTGSQQVVNTVGSNTGAPSAVPPVAYWEVVYIMRVS